MSERPLVHVVVVDHDGGDLTLACLRSILASDWPADRLRVDPTVQRGIPGVNPGGLTPPERPGS